MIERIFSLIKKNTPQPLFLFFQPGYHYLLAFLAAILFFSPSRRLKVIGVTGTDGKSSVVSLLHEILLQSGHRVASVSSIRFKINDSEELNMRKMTMPGRFFVQRFLRRAVHESAEYVILEVTSEGIRQFRHTFIAFHAAILTNVTPEHIESHGGFEKYRAMKAKLFSALHADGTAILNRDDPLWEFFARQTNAKKDFYSTAALYINGREYPVSDLSYQDRIRFHAGDAHFSSPLFGTFNVSNILAAVVAAHSFGISFPKISEAVKNVRGIPGRLEVIQEIPFRVIVDYAHTPNALRNVYETVRNLQPTTYNLQPRMICVLGAAGGGRDKWKRPGMGKIAAEFCGEIILTNEDPYDENPSQILSEIESGISNFPKWASPTSYNQFQISKVPDRREAIRKALQSAKPGDTVIITGKGAEQWIMGPGGVKIPWDDRMVAKEELQKMSQKI